jgi:hypothetical protein
MAYSGSHIFDAGLVFRKRRNDFGRQFSRIVNHKTTAFIRRSSGKTGHGGVKT